MKKGFEGMVKMAQQAKLVVTGEREYADGEYVIMHYLLTVTGPGGVRKYPDAEILRFANGKIAEHWNADQELPMMSANANGAF
jgi:predicted SnoaL-like aldol condensation-catalyzing enzyme